MAGRPRPSLLLGVFVVGAFAWMACSLEGFSDQFGRDAGTDVGTPDVVVSDAGCGDLVHDPKNCGFCGHDCRDRACLEDVCEAAEFASGPDTAAPTVLARGLRSPRGLAFNAQNLWVITDASSKIFRVPR